MTELVHLLGREIAGGVAGLVLGSLLLWFVVVPLLERADDRWYPKHCGFTPWRRTYWEIITRQKRNGP